MTTDPLLCLEFQPRSQGRGLNRKKKRLRTDQRVSDKRDHSSVGHTNVTPCQEP